MKIQKQAREIQYFFYSQAFADGVRAACAILFPSLLGSYLGYFNIGLTISLGAMCVSLTDAPGPVLHRRNGMVFSCLFALMVAVLTSYAQQNIITMVVEIALVSFFFSMLHVYGNRAASVGNAAMIIMILTMDKPIDQLFILPHAFLIFFGGVYYLIFSLLLHTIRPYRIAQRALGECIREIASYLFIKGDFYNITSDIDTTYSRMVAQQIIVNDKQDAVRELIFKTRHISEEATTEGRRLIITFVESVDMFEDITASYYDYSLLRNQFKNTSALDSIQITIKKIAREIDRAGIAIQTHADFIPSFSYDDELQQLREQINAIAQKERHQTIVLRKILVNLRKLIKDLKNVVRYFESEVQKNKTSLDHKLFVSHQSLDPKIFLDNINLKSSTFRHSLRVCIACVVGFMIAKMIGYGHYSYWILLTIAFILKPAFSLTKQRNLERIIGTVFGGAIGVFVLVFIPDKTVQFILMVLFMIGTYSFMRIRYLVMVICVTPYVLILFSFLGTEYRSVAEERIFDTVLGCAIAFSASYFLFPKWESDQLKDLMHDIIKANGIYLQKITEALSGYPVNMLEYKLARKEVYLSSANLSAAFHRMLSEPKSKQKGEKLLQQFVVQNHILYSNIAMLTTTILSKDSRVYPGEILHFSRKAMRSINESLKKFGDNAGIAIPIPEDNVLDIATTHDDLLLREQMEFIHKVSIDIDKTTSSLVI